MITGTSLTTNEANMEHMLVMGVAVPGEDPFTATVMREDLDAGQQTTYDAGVALVTGNAFTIIENTTSELAISRITSEVVAEDQGTFDFATMDEADQDTLRDLLALFVSLKD